MTAQQLEATRAMLTWLRAAGAQGLDNVAVKPTAYGGPGVFLAAPVETTTIARIPVECVTATPPSRGRSVKLRSSGTAPVVRWSWTRRRDAPTPLTRSLPGVAAGRPKAPARFQSRKAAPGHCPRRPRRARAARGARGHRHLLPRLRAARPTLGSCRRRTALGARWS